MKSVVTLWSTCLKEAGDQCHVRIQRDLAYALSRIEEEGLAFLAITLPSFDKDLLEALSLGRVESNHFHGFRRKGGLPAFMSGFLSRVFDHQGILRPDASPSMVRTIRQVLLLVSKIELPTSDRRNAQALAAYVKTDDELAECNGVFTDFAAVSGSLLGGFFAEVERRLLGGEWRPTHSTGALATRESYNSRWSNCTWTDRLQDVFPWWDDMVVSYHECLDLPVTVLARHDEHASRVSLVPKTLKGPRVIAMEPVWNMYVQQGILRVMQDVLLLPRFSWLNARMGWLDQLPNRELARLGSIDGSFSTLDLSEASDRVSLRLVEALLCRHPFLRSAVKASRSEWAFVPGHGEILLNKFASMGSALCFPFESLAFFCLEALAVCRSRLMSPGEIRVSDLPDMRVYGDDLIVPTPVARHLVRLIEAHGLKVNTRKSFTTGLFRESCGSDWFKGVDVSVFRMRKPLPSSDHQFDLIRSGIEFHNRAYSAGWFLVSEEIRRQLCAVGVPELFGPVGLAAPLFWSWDRDPCIRTNRFLHRPEVKCLRFREDKPLDPLEGWGALHKAFSEHAFPRDRDHLERDGRTRCVGMNIGWKALA